MRSQKLQGLRFTAIGASTLGDVYRLEVVPGLERFAHQRSVG